MLKMKAIIVKHNIKVLSLIASIHTIVDTELYLARLIRLLVFNLLKKVDVSVIFYDMVIFNSHFLLSN